MTSVENWRGKKSMKLGFAVILTISTALLPGCQTAPKSFTGPTGETVNTVRCTTDPTSCFETASEVCGGGSYKVVSSYRNAGGLFADILPGPVTWYTMSVVCGISDGVMPQFPLRGTEPAMPPPTSIQAPAANSRPTTTTCFQTGSVLSCTSQ